MTESKDRDELFRLFGGLSDGALNDEDRGRLEGILERDPAARRLWYLFQDVTVGLARRAGEDEGRRSLQEFPVRPRRDRGVVSVVRYAGVAAATLLVSMLFQSGSADSSPAPYVATLLESPAGAGWEGQRLPVGPWRVERGVAALRFDGGALVRLEGPAEVDLLGAGSAALRRGAASLRVPEEALGFRLATPSSELIDLGTEFGVWVEPSGATEVHVIEGQVKWKAAGRDFQTASAGEAVRMDPSTGPGGQKVRFQAERFVSLSAPVPERRAGTLLAYEGFEYESPSPPASEAAGGRGWSGPWTGRFVAGDVLDVDARIRVRPGKSLEGPVPLAAARGGCLEFSGEAAWRLRGLTTPIALASDGVTYVSFLVRKETAGGKSSRASLVFRSTHDYWPHYLGFGWSSENGAHLMCDGNNRVSPAILEPGRTYLFVGKIAASARRLDQTFLKVYGPRDAVDPEEPLSWTLTGPTFDGNVPLNLVILNGKGDDSFLFDEVRIGTSWSSVATVSR